jgi:anaerobic magnesium-protoporphyrin IX monomethyl ester cyclase
LVQPPSGLYRRDDRCQSKVNDQTVRIIFPPIYMAYMAAVLEQEGVECRIFDGPATGKTWDDLEGQLRQFQPDDFVIAVTHATLSQDVRAARLAKMTLPGIRVIARGEVFLTEDKTTLEQVREIDLVIRGESESAIGELGRMTPLEEVLGITYRAGGDEIRRNPNRPVLDNLDSLPYPARHLLDNSLYISPESRKPLTVIQANRGCPASCVFCPAWSFAGKDVRVRSPENIIGEIRQCREQFGINDFYFNADTFTYHKDWTIALCKAIIDSGMEIRWGCNSRVDTIDPQRLEWMKKAGCWVIGFGIESGSEESLKKMGKHTTLAMAEEAVRMTREAGIRVHTFFVFGFPWETRGHIEQTLAFARKLDPDFFDFNLATPLPGTPLWGMVNRHSMWEGENASYARSAIRTEGLSSEQLTRIRRRALWQMYLRPHYIWRTLRQAGPMHKKLNYLRAAMFRAKNLMFPEA